MSLLTSNVTEDKEKHKRQNTKVRKREVVGRNICKGFVKCECKLYRKNFHKYIDSLIFFPPGEREDSSMLSIDQS